MNKTTIFSLAACAAMAALPQSSPAQTVGTAGAVNPSTQGTAPGGGTRQVTLGSQVIFKERFVTSPQGSLQLVFLDKSTLNIGPNSDVVINEYVYDPNTRDGKMSVGLAKGALRFVGGQISHNGNAEIKTPVATIGLRGAVAVTSYDPQQQTSTTSSIVGTTTVTSNVGGTVTMVQGYTTQVGQGQPPSPPSRTPPQILANTTGQTTSQAGQTGGSSQPPSNQSANTQLGGDGSQAPTILANVTSTNRVAQQASTLTQAVTDTRQTTQVTSTTTSVQPVVQSAVAPRALAYFVSSGVSGVGPSSYPYLSAAFVGKTPVSFSPLLGYRVGGSANLSSSETIRTLQVGFGISGKGAAQTSVFFVNTDAFFRSGNDFLSNGGFFASTRQSATQRAGFASSAVSSTPGSIQFSTDGSQVPTNFQIDQNNYNTVTRQPVAATAREFGGPISGSGNNYGFSQSVTPTTVPAGLGNNRPEFSINGYAAGIVETGTFDAAGNRTATQFETVTGSNGNGTDFTAVFDPNTSRARADISVTSRTAGSRFQTGSFQFGSLDTTQPARSAYIDSNTFALRDRAVQDPNTGVISDPNPPVTSTTGSTFYSRVNSALTSWNTLTTQAPGTSQAIIAATDITPCACEFTQWGFWATQATRSNSNGTTDNERGNLLLWVAGQLSDRSLIPTVGSATYNGHIIGNVQYGTGTGTSYIAGGAFQHTVNFGAGTGSLAFTFDQRNYTGTSSLNTTNRANFSGTFANTTGATASGSLQGSFFGPNTGAGTAPLEQGGQFTISGAPPSGPGTYNAAGIFAARR